MTRGWYPRTGISRCQNRLCRLNEGSPSSSDVSLTSMGSGKGVTGVIHYSLSLKLKHDKARKFYFKIYHFLLRNIL